MKFFTQNSTYQVDVKGSRIRRLEGTGMPTMKFSKDGLWHAYTKLSAVDVGLFVVITWDGKPGHTTTSRVTLVELDEFEGVVENHQAGLPVATESVDIPIPTLAVYA